MLPTNNTEWGFYGSIRHHAEPEQAWPLAMQAIMAATEFGEEAVRNFLDSRRGRQFADDVANGLVDGLDLRVPVGGIHGFLGPNGSGKTTTIRMLLGLIAADYGHIRIFDHEVPLAIN